MQLSIEHPNGELKARIIARGNGFRVVLMERHGTLVVPWQRGGVQTSPNWSPIWRAQYDNCPLHVLRDRLHDHVMAGNRDALVISL